LTVTDPLMSFAVVGGATLGAISLALQLGSKQPQQSATLMQLGSDLDHLPERAAKVALEALGLGRTEAEKVANRPLPTMELPQSGVGFGGGEVAPTSSPVLRAAKGNKRVRARQ